MTLANSFLNLYKGNPTSGGTDGTAVSTGDNTAPLSFTLDATQNEVQSDTFAIRCESGYETCSATSISIISDTSSHWALSLDGTNWNSNITFSDTLSDTNEIFFVRANSSSSENPGNDTGVKIRVQTKISAA